MFEAGGDSLKERGFIKKNVALRYPREIFWVLQRHCQAMLKGTAPLGLRCTSRVEEGNLEKYPNTGLEAN